MDRDWHRDLAAVKRLFMDRDWHRDLAAVTRFVYGQRLA
jgi:hypothetical protein